ncbi:MAG: AraC family transcriptional regulator ligand-binding domain-containing protein [Myxococcales bacterium]|nr:AraC family transcriptional regulator ligand-binding domain-containing protein [Myxococcales bacterium]
MRSFIASLPRSVLNIVAPVGLDADALREQAQIDALQDPDGRVSGESYERLWLALARDPRARLSLPSAAALEDVGGLGVVGYVMAHSENMRQAFGAYERHGRVIGDFVELRVVTSPDGFRIELRYPAPFREIPLFTESNLVFTDAMARALAGKELPLLETWHYHSRNGQSLELETVLHGRGGEARYEQPCAALVYAPEIANWPVAKADTRLFPFLERHAASQSAVAPNLAPWTTRTRTAVIELMRGEEPSQREVARKLGASERTLQRRLAEEGMSFVRIADECRRELALLHVADPSLPLADVAFLLGYSDTTAFHRAFRRWTGSTPAELRRKRSA